jgi:Uma2 family endonuclease
LHPGDHLTRAEFERRYQARPDLKKAELIEGEVYMPSPVSMDHARPHFNLIAWLGAYLASTPGVWGGDNGTLRLDLDNELQPDAFLVIMPECGGQARLDDDGYISGAPELVAEVAVTSASIDLHRKLRVYRRHGVREYVVWRVEDRAIDWFVLRQGRFDPLPTTAEGQYRSETFPGLWLEPAALLRGELNVASRVVQQGLASPEHAAFVRTLQERRR